MKISTIISAALLTFAGTTFAATITTPDEMLERFVNYVKINSQSYVPQDPNEFPMTEGQIEMAKLLEKEVMQLNDKNITCYRSDDAYVYVEIASNIPDKNVKTLGFSCHLDVTPDVTGGNVHPRVIRNYKGGDIRLNDSTSIRVDSEIGAYLKECIGKTIIHTDGTTVLGGDDKNGCAIAMSVIETLSRSGNKIKHGKVQIVFCPNEDVGKAAMRIDSTRFNPDILIDIDGEGNEDILASNFTASEQIVRFTGHSVHPSEAKRLKYGDALGAAAYYIGQIPVEMRPENSEGTSGYLHPWNMDKVNTDEYLVYVRLRYFSKEEGNLFERTLDRILKNTAANFPNVKVELASNSMTYENVEYNMDADSKKVITRAMEALGRTPKFIAVRAGTTAAMFCANGLKGGVCLFSGQNAVHSIYEYSVLEDMYGTFEIALKIIEETAQL